MPRGRRSQTTPPTNPTQQGSIKTDSTQKSNSIKQNKNHNNSKVNVIPSSQATVIDIASDSLKTEATAIEISTKENNSNQSCPKMPKSSQKDKINSTQSVKEKEINEENELQKASRVIAVQTSL